MKGEIWIIIGFQALAMTAAVLRRYRELYLFGGLLVAPCLVTYRLPYSELGSLLLTLHLASVIVVGLVWLIATRRDKAGRSPE